MLAIKHICIIIVLLLTQLFTFAGVIQVGNSFKHTDLISALQNSNDFDTIVINKGFYESENIEVNKPITIIGKNDPVLSSKSGDELITILSDSVTIKQLCLKNVTTSYLKERSAIRVKKHKYFNISNNKIVNCFFGIYIEHGKNGIISNNIISGNATTEAGSGNGIHCWYSKNISIEGNVVKKQRDGIYFEFVENSSIKNNQSEENKRYGLHFMFSNDNDYLYNTFKNNGVGVAVMFSKKIKMEHNEFSYNWGRSSYGLLLKEINDAEIINNIFEQNTIAIFVEGSNRVNYNLNTFKSNGWAVKLSGGCEDNIFSGNNMISNSIDVVVNTKLSSNKFTHNYWASYTGYDLDRDGIGDVPHYPVKLFSFIFNQCPETIVLMRSLFVSIINFSEKVSPIFTPKEVFDAYPHMNKIE